MHQQAWYLLVIVMWCLNTTSVYEVSMKTDDIEAFRQFSCSSFHDQMRNFHYEPTSCLKRKKIFSPTLKQFIQIQITTSWPLETWNRPIFSLNFQITIKFKWVLPGHFKGLFFTSLRVLSIWYGTFLTHSAYRAHRASTHIFRPIVTRSVTWSILRRSLSIFRDFYSISTWELRTTYFSTLPLPLFLLCY